MNVKGTLIAFGLMTTLGCVVLHDTSTQWKDDKSAMHPTGPGESDCSFHRIEHNLYSCDSGRRTSIGLFPGMWNPPTTPGGVPKEWNGFVSWSIVQNIFCLCVPTVASMMYGPFPMSENSSLTRGGFFGAHRWRERSVERIEKREKSEEVVIHDVSRDTSRYFKGKGIAGQDGVPLYVGYPGYDVIRVEMTKYGAVDVLHDSSLRIRRFRKGTLDELSIAYEDRDADNDMRVKKYLSFRKQCTELRTRALEIGKKYKKYNRDGKLSFVENDVGILLEKESDISPQFESLVARINAVEETFKKQEIEAFTNKSKADDALKKGDWKSCRQIVKSFYPNACDEDQELLSHLLVRCDELQSDDEIKKMRSMVDSELAKSPKDLESIWVKVTSWPDVGSSKVQEKIKDEKKRNTERIVNEQVAVLKRHLMDASTQNAVENVLLKEYKNRKWLYDYSQVYTTVYNAIETCAKDRKDEIYLQFCMELSIQLDELSKDDVFKRLSAATVPKKDLSEIESLYELLNLNADDFWKRRNEIINRCVKTGTGVGMLIAGGTTYNSYQIANENPIVRRLVVRSVEKICTAIPSRMGLIGSNDELQAMRSLITCLENCLDTGLAKSAVGSIDGRMAELDAAEKRVAEEKRIAAEKLRMDALEQDALDSAQKIFAIEKDIELNPIRARKNFRPLTVTLKCVVSRVDNNSEYKSDKEIEQEIYAQAKKAVEKEMLRDIQKMNGDLAAFNNMASDGSIGQMLVTAAMLEAIDLKLPALRARALEHRSGRYIIMVTWNGKQIRIITNATIREDDVMALNKGDLIYATGIFGTIDEMGRIVRRCDRIEKSSK